MLRESEFTQISDAVYKHCGINLHDGKKELVQARIAKRLRESKFHSPSAYVAEVLSNPESEEFGHLIDAISTNLTSFFRENNHFHYLVEHFLPGAIDRKRKVGGTTKVRCWSAGCSTGEEPYTLGMVLSESAPNTDIKILATDISRKVLGVARAGQYDATRLKDVPAFMRDKYFNVSGGKAVASESLRRLIVFNYLNLMEPWPFRGPFDFIFCRNVMIYFDKETQEKLVNRYYDVLEPGGVLFTGHSESLTGIKHKFRYAQPTIYTKA